MSFSHPFFFIRYSLGDMCMYLVNTFENLLLIYYLRHVKILFFA